MSDREQMKVNIIGKGERNSDLQYWLSKTPEERIDAVEFLRIQFYALSGYNSIPRFIPAVTL